MTRRERSASAPDRRHLPLRQFVREQLADRFEDLGVEGSRKLIEPNEEKLREALRGGGFDPCEELVRGEAITRVRHALARLSPASREALESYYWRGERRTPGSSMHTMLSRARDRMAAELKGNSNR